MSLLATMAARNTVPGAWDRFGAIIGAGRTCFVYIVNDTAVHKSHQIWVGGELQNQAECAEAVLAREYAVYQHLGHHDRILRCLGLDQIRPNVHALRLERAPLGNVRDLVENNFLGHGLPEFTRQQMCRDVAEGLAYMHSRGVWHTDLNATNLLLVDGYRVKIADFGGAIIAGREEEFPVTDEEEPRYEIPTRLREMFENRPRLKRELFALGSVIYEIMAWKRPVAWKGNRNDGTYEREDFPLLEETSISLWLEPVIWKCWTDAYESVDQVVAALEECRKKSFGERRGPVLHSDGIWRYDTNGGFRAPLGR